MQASVAQKLKTVMIEEFFTMSNSKIFKVIIGK